jgi:hypothetical protein
MRAAGTLMRPRPVPNRLFSTIAAGSVILLALPIFLIAGWPFGGWGLAAVVWVASELFSVMLQRLKLGTGNLPSSGVVAFGMMFRAIAVMVVLIAVAVSNTGVGVSAALLFALAYTLELGMSLLSYFGTDES